MRRKPLPALSAPALALLAFVFACRETSDARRKAQSEGAALLPAVTGLHPQQSTPGGAPPQAARYATETRAPADPLDRMLPPEHPPQRLAFSAYRLAVLSGERLVVRRLGDLQIVADFEVPDARNVAPLVGGGFLVAGRDHVQRLSGIERRPELLPRAPRLGPTTLITSTRESEQFWMHYEGISALAAFDLGLRPIGPSLRATAFQELPEFDHRALLALGDGAVIYTTDSGLARIDAEGRREVLSLPELGGQVWRLARAARLDQVWAATLHHLYRVGVRGAASLLERRELPARPLAMASSGRDLAVLAIESLVDGRARLRVDVLSRNAEEPRVLRFDASPEAAPDAGPQSPFAPEVAVAPDRSLLAVHGFGLHVFDWARGRRLYPPEPDAQNLAPPPP